jgi:hypothetical protein
VFTAGNAVLVLDGPPPGSLRLDLREGDLIPLPDAIPVDDPPAAYEDHGGLVVSGTVPRDGDMFVGAEVLRHVLNTRLRREEGAAYAPWSHYERLDARTALVVAGSDLRPELVEAGGRLVVELLDRLADDGPDPAVVDEVVGRIDRAMRDPYAAMGAAVGIATRHLHGKAGESHEQMLERVAAVTPDGLRADFARLRESIFLGGPPASLAGVEFPRLTFPVSPPSEGGVEYRSLNWPADVSRLRVTESRIELSGEAYTRAIDLDDVVGWYVHADGLRQAVRRDGYALGVDPRNWRQGDHAVAQLDARIPAELHLPHPASGADPLARSSAVRRWGPVLARPLRSPIVRMVAVWIAIFVVAISILAVIANGGQSHLVGPLLVGGIVAARAVYRDRRSSG